MCSEANASVNAEPPVKQIVEYGHHASNGDIVWISVLESRNHYCIQDDDEIY